MADGQQEWVRVSFGDGAPVDVVALAQRVLKARGVGSNRVEDDLHVSPLGLVVSPRVLSAQPSVNQGVRSLSIVRVRHADVFPTPIFEFQHGVGDDLGAALKTGLDGWAQLDWPVLADATRATPEHCAVMLLEFPAKDGRAAHQRRVLLGPPARYGDGSTGPSEAAEEHPFCPCCLLTNGFEAFKPLLEQEQTLGLRLYAARDASGAPLADCRVNGEDFAPGKAALVAYAATWARRGFEFRKQYVIMQSGQK
jgi:Family of unknown function (DUF6348)